MEKIWQLVRSDKRLNTWVDAEELNLDSKKFDQSYAKMIRKILTDEQN